MSELKKNDNFLLKEINDCGKFCTGCAACDNVCPVEAINMFRMRSALWNHRSIIRYVFNVICVERHVQF